MDIKEAIKSRHSVRQFINKPIADDLRQEIDKLIKECNEEGELDFQIVYDDPECFNTFLAHVGKFENARNYIVLAGKKSIEDLDERCGYYGEKIVLAAQQLGLNTCWVAGTYGKSKIRAEIPDDEKRVCVIAIGYGANEGTKHRSKPVEKLCDIRGDEMQPWFRNGLVAAMMAPTALNQQKFFITLENDEAVITTKKGMMTKIDLGIVKYNFEAASGHKCRA
ncbi:nitroreductase family protein [Ruminococcus flavefaciens]|uniref:nitroreductase family protein n=1 Tax=Ruminococcus flavefaciens TaxID=1265 RepID=UPI00048E90AE|nr:nitroreductase family protein [Ruminococcus flavefaciens]